MRDADGPNDLQRLWFVAFLPGRARHWWSWFSWGRWKHVACFRFDPCTEHWLVFQYGTAGIQAEIIGREHMSRAVAVWKRAGASIVAIDEGETMPALLNLPLNCVGLVKGLVKRGGGALSPWGLKRNLRREGSEPAWEVPDGVQIAQTGSGAGGAAEIRRGAEHGGADFRLAESPPWTDESNEAAVRGL